MLLAEIALLVLLLAAATLAVYRVHLLRGGGTEAVYRDLPAQPGRRWRHGVLRYGDSELLFFRVASVRPGADRRIPRGSLTVLDRRDPHSYESDVLAPGSSVLRIAVNGEHAELALSCGALTALLSWLESSPPGRARRQARR